MASCPHDCNPARRLGAGNATSKDYGSTREQGIQAFHITKEQGMQAGCRSEMQQLMDSFQLEEKLPKVVIGTDAINGKIPTVVVCDKITNPLACQCSQGPVMSNLSPCMIQDRINQKARAVNCLQYKVSRLHIQMKTALETNAQLNQQMVDLIHQQNSCPYSCDKPIKTPAKAQCPANISQGCSGPCNVKKQPQDFPAQFNMSNQQDSPGTSTKSPAPYSIQALIDRLDRLLEERKNSEGCSGPCNVLKKIEDCFAPCNESKQKQDCPAPCNVGKQQTCPTCCNISKQQPCSGTINKISALLDGLASILEECKNCKHDDKQEGLNNLLQACLGPCNTFRELACQYPSNQNKLSEECCGSCNPKASSKQGKNQTKECAGPCNTQGLNDKLAYLSQSVPDKCDRLQKMMTECYFRGSNSYPVEQDEDKKSKCTGPCNIQRFNDKIKSLMQDCPAELDRTGHMISNCILPNKADHPTDCFQPNGKTRKSFQPAGSVIDNNSCLAICNTNNQVSSQIDEIEAELNYLRAELAKAQEENEQLEHQRKFLKCLRPCIPPQESNLCGKLDIAQRERKKLGSQQDFLGCLKEPCPPCMPSCGPTPLPCLPCPPSRPALPCSPCPQKPALPPCPQKPALPPCCSLPPRPTSVPKSYRCCR